MPLIVFVLFPIDIATENAANDSMTRSIFFFQSFVTAAPFLNGSGRVNYFFVVAEYIQSSLEHFKSGLFCLLVSHLGCIRRAFWHFLNQFDKFLLQGGSPLGELRFLLSLLDVLSLDLFRLIWRDAELRLLTHLLDLGLQVLELVSERVHLLGRSDDLNLMLLLFGVDLALQAPHFLPHLIVRLFIFLQNFFELVLVGTLQGLELQIGLILEGLHLLLMLFFLQLALNLLVFEFLPHLVDANLECTDGQ